MDRKVFIERLRLIMKMRSKLTRKELVETLNIFWKHNKSKLNQIYAYYCYNILKSMIRHFDTIIEGSRGRYYYVHSKVLTEVIPNDA